MQKHTAQPRKTAVRHARAGPARQAAKRIPVKKAAAAKMSAPTLTMMLEPQPKVIEVMELDFVDPDILPDEEAVVTGFDDEDF